MLTLSQERKEEMKQKVEPFNGETPLSRWKLDAQRIRDVMHPPSWQGSSGPLSLFKEEQQITRIFADPSLAISLNLHKTQKL